MIKVVLLGYGNVNTHLLKALSQTDKVNVVQVYNRRAITLPPELKSIPCIDNLDELEEADVYIIAISDDSIHDFSESLPFENRLVVHTSGGVDMDMLSSKNRRGVFYPLQTFSKQREVDFRTIPICVEADDPADLKLLHSLGELISDTVTEIDSKKRAKLHVAAVFVNNFVNHIYHIAGDILAEDNISFDLLAPLIQETAKKIETLSPEAAQTGPAKRNDRKTIEKHQQLINNPKYKEVYALLSQLIHEHHSQ